MRYQDICNDIDKSEEVVDYVILSQRLNSLENESCDINVLEAERVAFNLLIVPMTQDNSKGRKRFASKLKYADGSEIPDQTKIGAEQIKIFENRIRETHNPFMLARYYDLIWEFGGKLTETPRIEIAETACEAYLTCSSKLLENKNSKFDIFLDRAFEYALTIKSEFLQNNCFDLYRQSIDSIIEDKKIGNLLNLSKLYRLALKHKGMVSIPITYLEYLLDIFSKKMNQMEEIGNYIATQNCLYEMIELAKVLKWESKDIFELRKKICNLFALQADNILKNEKISAGNASMFFQFAHSCYIEIGETEEAQKMKNKIREANRTMKERGEFHEIKVEAEFPSEAIEEAVEQFKQTHGLNNILKLIGYHPYLLPDFAAIKEHAIERVKGSIMHKMFGMVIISENDCTLDIRNNEEDIRNEINHGMDCETAYSELVFNGVIEYLKGEYGLDKEKMSMYFGDWELSKDEHLDIIDTAFERYFSQDYISAVYILAPKIEAIIRDMFDKAGYCTTTLKSGRQQEQNFGDFLRRPEVIDTLNQNANLHSFVEFVMTDQLGWNVRNRVAHGLMNKGHCSKKVASILLLILIRLTDFTLLNKDNISNDSVS